MKSIYYLILPFLLMFMLGCEKDQTEATDIMGEWKLVEEKIGSAIIIGEPTVFEPVQSNKTITFYSNGTFSSNGDMCFMTNQASSQNTGLYYESLLSIEPNGCQSAAASSGIKYQLDADTLIISYQCFEACQQKYYRI